MESKRDMAADRRDADASTAADRREADASAKRNAGNKVFILRAKDVHAEPFHFVGVPPAMVVVASSEDEARKMAAASHPAMVPAGFGTREVPLPEGAPEPKPDDPPRAMERVRVEAHSPWTDKEAVSCEEPDLSMPGVIARDMPASM